MSPRDMISTHHTNDDLRHFAFVRRTGFRASEFRQEWRPKLRDVLLAVGVAAALLCGFALTSLPDSDEEITASFHRAARP